MKVSIIGSNSFSGSSFIKYLLERDYEVLAISRSGEPDDVFLPYKWENREISNLSFVQLDLNKNLKEIVQRIQNFRPNYIVNFAAQGMVAESWKTPEDWYQTNVVSQVKLHDSLRKFDFVDKFLNFSTPEVYGNTKGRVDEGYRFCPNTPYAVSRASCDLHLMSFFKNYDFPVTFTRAANVFGEGQQLYRIVPKTIISGLLCTKLNLHGGGTSERSFIHIEDVCDATYKVMKEGVIGETYHISTEETLTIKELVWTIAARIGKNPDEFVVNTNERLGKDHSYALDSGKIRSELSWRDVISLEAGIDRTIRWVASNLEALKKMPAMYIHKS
jgi:dTDP-glucose 4,6-dehydratase